jgi:magnesium-transporting ATPase (P-type)
VGLLSNRFLLVGIGVELAVAVMLVYVPGLNSAFHQAPLGVAHWALLVTFAPIVLVAEEARKAVVRRRAGIGGPYPPAPRLHGSPDAPTRRRPPR